MLITSSEFVIFKPKPLLRYSWLLIEHRNFYFTQILFFNHFIITTKQKDLNTMIPKKHKTMFFN